MTNDSMKVIDPNILLSLVNTKLRDMYDSLYSLCEDMDINEKIILERLKNIGYYYNNEQNQFKQK